MTELRTGLRGLLSWSWAYQAMQWLVGAPRLRRRLRHSYLALQPGLSVLDLGCGPADLLPYLGDVRYTGIDLSSDYIAQARRRFGARAEFLCQGVQPGQPLPEGPFQRILAVGLLHHLDDESVLFLMQQAAERLAPGGRLVTIDCCYHPGQSALARWLVSQDRGRRVRRPEEYAALARPYFPELRGHLHQNLINIPYSHFVMVGERR